MLNRILGFAVAVLALAACQGPTSVAPVEPGPWEADTLDYVGVWSGPISWRRYAGTEWERLVRSAYIPTTDRTVTLPTGYEYSSVRLLYCQAELKDFRGAGGSFRDRPSSHACSATLTALGSRPEARLLYPADTLGANVYPKEGDAHPHARPRWVIETVRRTR